MKCNVCSAKEEPEQEKQQEQQQPLAHLDEMNEHGHLAHRVEAIGHAPGAAMHRVARKDFKRIAKSDSRMRGLREKLMSKERKHTKKLDCSPEVASFKSASSSAAMVGLLVS